MWGIKSCKAGKLRWKMKNHCIHPSTFTTVIYSFSLLLAFRCMIFMMLCFFSCWKMMMHWHGEEKLNVINYSSQLLSGWKAKRNSIWIMFSLHLATAFFSLEIFLSRKWEFDDHITYMEAIATQIQLKNIYQRNFPISDAEFPPYNGRIISHDILIVAMKRSNQNPSELKLINFVFSISEELPFWWFIFHRWW